MLVQDLADFYNTGCTTPVAPVDVSVEQLIETSSKFRLLDAFLERLRRDCPREKVVIVSNFVSVLDQVERLAVFKKYNRLPRGFSGQLPLILIISMSTLFLMLIIPSKVYNIPFLPFLVGITQSNMLSIG